MDNDTLTTNTSGTSCSESLQFSTDSEFGSCIEMTDIVSRHDNFTQYEITAPANLNSSTTYYMRVTASAKDTSSNAIAQTTVSLREPCVDFKYPLM